MLFNQSSCTYVRVHTSFKLCPSDDRYLMNISYYYMIAIRGSINFANTHIIVFYKSLPNIYRGKLGETG